MIKSIEKYDIERNEWGVIKMQLNYERSFSSAIAFENRFIYIVGGTTNTESIELFDVTKE